ncbi:MAG: SpoIIE family protein phosphatase [bacterium]
MPPKTLEAQEENQLFTQVPFPLAKSQSPSKKPVGSLSVRPPQKIPRKVLHFFKYDPKTGAALGEEKRIFLAQVFMHELDEGIRILEQCGRSEQARLLKISNPKVHLSNQIKLLREWLDQEPIRDRPPERVSSGFKLRNNQNGELKAAFREGKAFGLTSHGLQYKDRNEDALLFVPERGFMAVFDGMGGHIGGNIASGTLADFIEYGLKAGMTAEKAIDFANEAVLQRTRNDPRLGGVHAMGSTLSCAEVKGSSLKSLHVGDSKLLVIRKGKIVHESADHTNGQELLRGGLIDEETAHALNHILSRSLGCDSIFASRDLERSEVTLQPRDRVLLASDGITDNFYAEDFSLSELAQMASTGSLEDAAHRIQTACFDRVRKGELPSGFRAKPDNVTVMLYEHGA